MSYKGIKNIIEEASQGLKWPVIFDTGRVEDLNKYGQQNAPVLWLLPFNSTGTLIVDGSTRFYETYACEVFIFKKDRQDSSNDDQFSIVSDCHELAMNFTIKLADLASTEDYELSDVTKNPVYKFSSKVLTGVSVNFSISIPDDFDYCE